MLAIHLLSLRPVLSPGDAVMRITAQMDLMAGGEIVNIAWVFLARNWAQGLHGSSHLVLATTWWVFKWSNRGSGSLSKITCTEKVNAILCKLMQSPCCVGVGNSLVCHPKGGAFERSLLDSFFFLAALCDLWGVRSPSRDWTQDPGSESAGS